MTTPRARIERALDWYSGLGSTDIDQRDVEVVAAMGIRELSVGRQLALHHADALLGQWSDLVAAIDGVVVQQVVTDTTWSGRRSRRSQSEGDESVKPASAAPAPATPAPATPAPVPETTASQGAAAPRTRLTPHPPAVPDQVGPSGDVIGVDGFAPYAALEDIDYAAAQSLTYNLTGDGDVRMSWPALPVGEGNVVVYRVVTSMTGEPYTPDQQTVAATTGLFHVNDDPRREPYLNVQVWANVGPDVESAKSAQPVLHARGLLVLPPASFDIRVSEGQVVGSWPVASDDVTVDVMYVEGHLADRIHGFDPTRRLPSVQQGGFRHDNPPAGTRLEYRVVARLERMGGDGQMRQGTSPYLSRLVDTPAVIEAVRDLEVTLFASGDAKVDLSWTTPPSAVDVHIYMTDVEPPAGLDRQDLIDRSSLDGAQLTPDRRLIHPTDKQDGRTLMRDVPWPRTWARAWFVPVTVLDDRHMKAGPSLVRSRPPEPVVDLRLIDRVDTKTLTFEWPEAVELVRVYVTPRGVELQPASQRSVAELTQSDYRRFGGLQLPPGVLNDEPSTVYAVSTTYSDGEAIMAKPVSIDYPGMRQLRYQLRTQAPQQTGRGAQSAPGGQRQLVLEALTSGATPIRFGLCSHQSHLPLTAETAVLAYEFHWTPNKDEPFAQVFDLSRAAGGFIRLFALVSDEEQRTLAIGDPSIEQLWIAP